MYIKAVETINEKYGTNFTWLEWHKFVEDERFATVQDAYGSDRILKIVASFQKGKKELVRAVFGSMKQSRIRTQSKDNDLTNEEILRLLYKNREDNRRPSEAKVKRKLEALNIK